MTIAVKELVAEQYLPIDLLQSVALDRPLHRFTLEEYHWLIEHDFFQPEDRVELIEGFLVEMSPMHLPHADTVDSLTEELVIKVKQRAKVRIQQAISLPEQTTEPEPDFVLAIRRQNYRTKHPVPADVKINSRQGAKAQRKASLAAWRLRVRFSSVSVPTRHGA